jgi:hypothetical protein
VVKKLQPELRIRESCGFALHVSRGQSLEQEPGNAKSALVRDLR